MILKDEPKSIYYYKIINPKANKPKKYTDWGDYNWSSKSSSGLGTEEVLNKEDFKLCFSTRYAFVGNMQEKLNETFKCDLKDRWIQQVSNHPKTRTEIIFKEIYVDRWIPILLIERFKKWIKSKFSKEIILYEGYSKENADRDFDDLVYNYKQTFNEYGNNPYWDDVFKHE